MELSAKFKRAQAFTEKWEGGFCDDKYDRGGATKYGISYEYLRGLSDNQLALVGIKKPITRATIQGLTKDQARQLFCTSFWLAGNCEDLPEPMGWVLYDYAVNCGLRTAIRRMQRVCNEKLGTELVLDGVNGPRTSAALFLMTNKPGIRAMLDDRRMRYEGIVKANATQKKFLKGWMNRVADLEKQVIEFMDKR